VKRSKFSLSNYKLFSCDMGELVPCGLVEVLPGDTIQQATSALVRAAPLLAPVMHPVHVGIRHFFVPHRLIWEDFEKFITGGPDGMDTSAFPTLNLTWSAGTPPTGSGVVGGLADYLGCPTGVNNLEVSALPFRGYALIWNEYFRDQDLQTPLTIDVTSGPDTTTNTALQYVNWEKDYFTSSRPWEQKGPSITLPLGSQAPVKGIGFGTPATMQAGSSFREAPASGSGSTVFANAAITSGQGIAVRASSANTASNRPDVYADLTGVSAITVNALREAMALQRFEEARARFGSRYTEYLMYLGVRSSDARLQRPEYLGGGKQTLQFSEVLQTAEGNDPVGELRGHGIAAMRSNRYRRFFEEHGYVFSFMHVRPKTVYAQGIARTWNRRTREDFWQMELQHIGQQEVLNKEVYAQHASPDGVFGFQDRYDEYRRQENTIAGEFRTTELNYWHFARQFGSSPALNSDFVKCVPVETPFASQISDTLYVMAHHSIQARRMVAGTGSSFIY
jgi:hypothetical protein